MGAVPGACSRLFGQASKRLGNYWPGASPTASRRSATLVDVPRMPSATTPRRYERVGLRKGPWVAWQGPSGRTVSRASTLGLGGLFIEAPEPAKIGAGLKIVFNVAGGEVRARAMVRNSHPGRGMGIEFVFMRPEHRARLAMQLQRLLGAVAGKSS